MNIVDQQIFRDAMSCMGMTVNIITTDGPAGRTGFTVSAVCNMADTPPTLLMCLSRGASVWPVFNENRTLCVSTLSAGQEPSSDPFDDRTPTEHHFVAVRWQTDVTGCPQLEEALVSLDCCISQAMSVGIHDTLSRAIEAIHCHAIPHGLVWFDRSYHALMRPAY